MKRHFTNRSLDLPWFNYKEADPHNFDWLRFSKAEFCGFTLYFLFEHPGHYNIEDPKQMNIIQVRCLIHTEETYNKIRSSIEEMNQYLNWIGCNTGDRALAIGFIFGCYEWENLFPEDRFEREEEYKNNPPKDFSDDKIFDFRRISIAMKEV